MLVPPVRSPFAALEDQPHHRLLLLVARELARILRERLGDHFNAFQGRTHYESRVIKSRIDFSLSLRSFSLRSK